MRVQKRDGRVEDWNGAKIVSAISKAAAEAGEEIKEFCVLLSKIEAKAQGKETILVSEVHKMVEDVLMGSRYKKTGRKCGSTRRKGHATLCLVKARIARMLETAL